MNTKLMANSTVIHAWRSLSNTRTSSVRHIRAFSCLGTTDGTSAPGVRAILNSKITNKKHKNEKKKCGLDPGFPPPQPPLLCPSPLHPLRFGLRNQRGAPGWLSWLSVWLWLGSFEFEPHIRLSVVSAEPASDPLFPSLSIPLPFLLSLSEIN